MKRWLPEHPGGDRIIPAQSLDAEAARHFELYHSSRESFLYLKHFYVGEVRSEDRREVPLVAGETRASDEFLAQARAVRACFPHRTAPLGFNTDLIAWVITFKFQLTDAHVFARHGPQLREYTDDFRIDASGGGGEDAAGEEEDEAARVAVHLGVRSRKA